MERQFANLNTIGYVKIGVFDELTNVEVIKIL